MTPLERLAKLNAQRDALKDRKIRKAKARKSTAADHREHVLTTCKVLKFERKLEKTKVTESVS